MCSNKLKIFFLLILILNIKQSFSQDYWEIVEMPVGLGVSSIDVNSNNDLFAGGAGSGWGGVFSLAANTNNWDTLLCLNNDAIGAIYIDRFNNVYAATDELYFSENNGTDWDMIFDNQINGIKSIYRSQNKNCYIGFWGGIYKSDTNGLNWTQVLTLENYELVNEIIEDINNDMLYTGTINFLGEGGVYCSEDGGDSWEQIGLSDHYVAALAINSSGDLFAGTRGHHYLYTGGVFVLPYGESEWINLKDDELVTSILINVEDDIYIGCSGLDYFGGGVRFSNDNGQSWEDISLESMYMYDIEDLAIDTEGYLYAREQNSGIPLYKSINSTISDIKSTIVGLESIKTYNFPNPFNGVTTVYYELPFKNNADMYFSVYNSVGNLIETISISQDEMEDGFFKWNSQGLQDGIYLYIISINNSSITNKMILMK